MPEPYLTQLAHFTSFLTAYTHTLLYLRAVYPPSSFVRTRFHNTPIWQSRHPAVCAWIQDAVAAVHAELLNGSVSRIAIVVFHSGAATDSQDDARAEAAKPRGDVLIMERYLLDVSTFPVVAKPDRTMDIEYESSASPSPPASPSRSPPRAPKDKGKAAAREPLDKDAPVDLSEQFRAALILLATRTSALQPLPPDCSFNITMELKDEADVDPPVGHPQAWIPVQNSLQKTGRKGRDEPMDRAQNEGADLGGHRVTPIRAVQAGVFRFECWVEEGKDKFKMLAHGKGDASSGRSA